MSTSLLPGLADMKKRTQTVAMAAPSVKDTSGLMLLLLPLSPFIFPPNIYNLFPPNSVSVAPRSELRETLTNRHGKKQSRCLPWLEQEGMGRRCKQGSELRKREAFKKKLPS
jgi:hypothetical protein